MSLAIASMRALLNRACTGARPLAAPITRHSLSFAFHRSYSTLPIIEQYVPRCYPFRVTLTTEMLLEENLQMRPMNPHDLPHYKSTLTVNVNELPLSVDERHIFRMLVGPRLYSPNIDITHPVPSFLQESYRERLQQTTKRSAKKPCEVRFVSSKLQSARANENRVFQLLDECIKQSKLLVREFANDGEYVTPSEEEIILTMAKMQLKQQRRATVEGNQQHAIEGSTQEQSQERVRVPVSAQQPSNEQ